MLAPAAALLIQIIPPVILTKTARERQLGLEHIPIPLHHTVPYLDPRSGRHFVRVAGPAQVKEAHQQSHSPGGEAKTRLFVTAADSDWKKHAETEESEGSDAVELVDKMLAWPGRMP
jgi:hypothetical protein